MRRAASVGPHADELAPERVADGEQEIGEQSGDSDVDDDVERFRRLVAQPPLQLRRLGRRGRRDHGLAATRRLGSRAIELLGRRAHMAHRPLRLPRAFVRREPDLAAAFGNSAIAAVASSRSRKTPPAVTPVSNSSTTAEPIARWICHRSSVATSGFSA